jgi:hypothetical protein
MISIKAGVRRSAQMRIRNLATGGSSRRTGHNDFGGASLSGPHFAVIDGTRSPLPTPPARSHAAEIRGRDGNLENWKIP